MGNRETIALIAGLVASWALAPAAGAADVEYYTGNGTAGPNDIGFAEASCPPFSKPTGGGSFSSGAWGESYITALEIDDAFVGRETYQAWSHAVPEVSLSATVACVKGKAAAGLRYMTKKRQIASGAAKAVVARCPSGLLVVGGEVTHDAPGAGLLLESSRPVERNAAWEGKLLNATASPQQMFVTAVCASGGLGKHLRYVKQAGTAEKGEQGLVVSSCPTGTEVVGGGVRVGTSGAGLFDQALRINSSGVQSSGTGSASYVDAGDANAPFTNYAICHG